MNLDFRAIIALLGPEAALRIANALRPAARYLFATLLPERLMNSYHVQSATMTIRTTMAGLVGMDSPYPPGGMIEHGTFDEQTAKIAIEVPLTEKALRDIQALVMAAALRAGSTNDILVQEVLNFLNKVILQAHMDRSEWLRGQALLEGALTWSFGGKTLDVDYGIPAANMLANRTGTSAYGGSASVFWSDVRTVRSLLRYNVRAFIAHSTTIDEIVTNDANAIEVLSQSGGAMEIRKWVSRAGNTVSSPDARDRLTLIAYDEEAEILDLSDPSQTVSVPFMTVGKVLAVGNNSRSGYRVGEGATDDPNQDNSLGYTHIGPTVEGGGRPGRWADLFTPERQPWQLIGRGVSNELPVLEAPEKVAVMSTDM